MKAYVRQSTQEDVDYLCNNLRPEDREEVIASHGSTKNALQTGLDLSDECWTFLVKETHEIAGIYGVARQDDMVACVWLLTTPAVEKIWMTFLRETKRLTKELNKKYSILTNSVDAEYTVAIKWLKFLGFTFINKHNYGGKPFLEFVRI
jgi:hypothetical protein